MPKDFLVTYGSYITLILIGIGYFIKRVFDLRSKKIELQYAFFQERKIDAIKKFFEAYGVAERMWHHIPIHSVFKNTFTAEQLDEMIWPSMNALRFALVELSLYADENEIRPFNTIHDGLVGLSKLVADIFLFPEHSDTLKKTNDYYGEMREAFNRNQGLLQKIGDNIRRQSKI